MDEEHGPGRVFAGVDWGGSHHQLCVVDSDGQRRLQVRVAHDVAGLAQLERELARFGRRLPVAVERAEGLLVERLQAGDHQVFAVSPRIAARARERYRVASVEDDRFDEFVLADTLRFEHASWRALPVPSPALAELRALVRDRDRLLETQQRTEAQLRAVLEAYHPAATRLFSSIDRDITLAFIADYPTPAAAERIAEQRMAGFCRRQRYTGRGPGRGASGAPEGQPAVWRGRHRRGQGALGADLRRAARSAEPAARRLRRRHRSGARPELFGSFPGVGLITCGTLLAEIGEDRAHYPTPGVLLAEAGLAPVTRSSGRATRVRFRYAANIRLRESVMWWSYNSLKTSPWAKDGYDAARGRGQHHYRALRGLGARWVRVLWRCWQDRTPYDPQRHRGNRQIDATDGSPEAPAAA